jgi:hypothetical protein
MWVWRLPLTALCVVHKAFIDNPGQLKSMRYHDLSYVGAF